MRCGLLLKMTRHHWIQLVCVVLMLLLWAAAGMLSTPIRAQRLETQIYTPIQTQSISGQATVSTVTTAAMGAFRGLVADILWYRTNKLKEEGKFYEANSLAEWITALQPSFASVWVFHAWNMSYNISVATYTPQERWDWVNKGIRLLRDRGIPLNPKNVLLYKELGYIFFHKVGGYMDDMHWYYKRQLAQEWQEVLGAPVDSNDIEKVVEPWRKIVDAPDTLVDLQKKVATVEPLLAELDRLGFEADVSLLRQVGRLLMFKQSADAEALGLVSTERPDLYDRRLVELYQKPAHQEAWDALLPYMRKQALRDVYFMDPAFMLDLMLPQDQGGYGFGPLDYRHPAAQALYWNARGTFVSTDLKGDVKFDLLNTYRQVVHSLQSLTDSGRVNFDPISGHLDLLPDPRFIPAYEKAWELAIEDLLAREYRGNPRESYQAGHENFLLKAIVWCYLYGSQDEADRYYRRVRELYGNRPDRIASGKFTQPLTELVFSELSENLDQLAYARQFIDSMLIQAFTQGLANNRSDIFERSVQMAKLGHDKNQARAVANPNLDQRRMALLPFDQVVAETYIGLMLSPINSAEDILFKVRVWRNTPSVLQAKVYLRLQQAFCGTEQGNRLGPG
ncbi:MAG: hypothetical protein HC898_07955 [Phycisphaerales bacterium]|nr:hypothetical protein [Phycisphaerales bacterium]